jgi:two-component system, NtrC family, response regulator AtoC
MSMRRGSRRAREATLVAARAFAWDRALVATIRHSTLPWEESFAAEPITSKLGSRDRLSLLAQFAAHQALLHFAGVGDGELDPGEWAVVQKRGCDVRLIRVAARAAEPSNAPPALTLAQQFAEVVEAELDVLKQPWARADAVYAEAFAKLTGGAAADLRWLRASACGEIAAPGPEGLGLLTAEAGRFRCPDLEAVQRFTNVTIYRGVSPLERYSAIRIDPKLSVAAAAERILTTTSGIFAVERWEAFDEGSRQVVEILANAHHGAWLFPDGGEPLPRARYFVVSPRLEPRRALEPRIVSRAWLEQFAESPQFAAYLTHGDVPPPPAILPSLAEPARSYLGALAHLGTRIPRALAAELLAEFHCSAPLEDLAVDGVTTLDEHDFVFASDAVRDEAAHMVPEASRAAIAKLAAERAEAVLENTEWATAEECVAALRRVPALSPSLTLKYAHALIDCGRYRDAREVSSDELVLARAERRTGDYATALARLERMEPNVIRAEVLRLLGRHAEARRVLDLCDGDDIEVAYERAVLAIDAGDPFEESWMRPHYLASRFATHAALHRGEFEEAARCAVESRAQARCVVERIDASLDHVFALFAAGRWSDARASAVEALQEVEETQGDRAAGGILFTLAYLAADEAQWAHASQRIARLRHYYAATCDTVRLEELQLLTAHLDFSRGRFADARRAAQAVFETRGGQVKEAAALILDEIDRVERKPAKLRSTGRSGNVELTRRHERLKNGGAIGDSIPDRLFAFRTALADNDLETAKRLAGELHLVFDTKPVAADVEQRVLRTAAIRDFPFADHDFDVSWSFATRNRLGHWHSIGPHAFESVCPDSILCSDREVLYFEGARDWSTEGREAVAALFHLRAENERLKRIIEQEEHVRPAKAGSMEGLVGESAVMREIYTLIPRVARRDVPVCILGESGTGKELIARAIHRQSPRRQKTFTAVNCAALPENLIESELCGHVRGAFTGADRDRAGLIETTDGGTLFLDEIGEMPLGAQAKLLRFLQEGEFRRVGDTVNRSADVRIVSATNRKLETAVEEGRFRDDLYYRIRGVEVSLPALRERAGDVVILANHFLANEHDRHRSGPTRFSSEVEAVFTAYAWPGNVRELQNTIRAAHAMAGDAKQIELEHLPERLRNVIPAKTAAGSYQDAVARFRRDLIERSLLQVNGNQNRAAAMLKISRQALAYQIKELGILARPQSLRIAKPQRRI